MKSLTSIFFIVAMLVAFSPMNSAEAACGYTGSNSAGYRCSPRATQYQSTHTQYQYQYQSTASLEAYIAQLIAVLEQLQSLQSGSTNNTYTYTNYSGNSDVDVSTKSARGIDDEDAILRGEVDFNNEDEATVWFEYGRSRSNLNEDTTHVVLDENDDDESFTAKITDLRDETTYYFRAVAEDEDGDRDYGAILSFETDDDNVRRNDDDDAPEVDTDNASNISDDSARLRGEVDMNDFRNGLVFFVYGEDEDQVEDIEDDFDEYRDIDEDGDDLQKIKVDSDLDNSATYTATINGLDDDTDFYFTLCVEHEDEDNDETIVCGKVEDFETDN